MESASRMSAVATAGTAGGAQALQCKQVLRVLKSETRVPGSLRLNGTELWFEPDMQAQAAGADAHPDSWKDATFFEDQSKGVRERSKGSHIDMVA